LQDGPPFEADIEPVALLTKEGVGETSGQTAGPSFQGVHSRENRSGRRNGFSSFGADPWSAISSGPGVSVESGPDVFADALALPPVHWPGIEFPKSLKAADRSLRWPPVVVQRRLSAESSRFLRPFRAGGRATPRRTRLLQMVIV